MLTFNGIGGLIVLLLDIWAIVSIIGSGATTGKKVVWVFLVVVLPIVGFIIWFITGPRSGQNQV